MDVRVVAFDANGTLVTILTENGAEEVFRAAAHFLTYQGDHGYRKPDRRLFQLALDGMAVAAENTLYIGNDMQHDIFGAQ